MEQPDHPRSDFPTKRGWKRMISRGLRTLLLLILIAAAVNGAVDYGHREQVCIHCSASCKVNEFYLCGVGGQWGRSIRLGRLGAFIEESDKTPCPHRWLTCSRESGNALYRSVQFEAVRRQTLYTFMNTTKLNLAEMRSRDPMFVRSLKKAIEQPEDDANAPVIKALLANVEDFLKESIEKP